MNYFTPEYFGEIIIWITIGVTILKALHYIVYVTSNSPTMREVHKQQKTLRDMKKAAYESKLLEDINKQINEYTKGI